MNILVVCQHYYPEPFRLNDICEELVKKGNNVTVVTGIPNYPIGEIYEGYKGKEKRKEIINGVNVRRCFTIPRKTGVIMRIINYYSFAISSTLYCKKLKEDFDVVFVNQLSPIMMACGGIKYKRKYKKKLLMYCMDLWPESLKIGGIKEKSIIFKIFHKISKRIYKASDRILVTSKSFKDYLLNEFGIDESKISHLPQYAESLFSKRDCSKKANDKIDLMFAGNMGAAQSLDTIMEAAEKLKRKNNIRFHFVGDGIELERLKEYAKTNSLDNVIFHGRKKIDEMPKYYSMADAMLVTLNADGAVSGTVPGKVQTYMAAGKPIIGAINGETKNVIKEANCGFCGSAQDSDALVGNIKKFIKCNNKDELGKNSFEYYNKNYKRSIFINKLIKELELLCKNN